MAEDILGWLDGTIKDSQLQWEYIQTQPQDDPDRWGDIFAASLQETDSFSGCGLLLTGADSYSKQSVAIQMLRHLVNDAYEGVFLDGMDLSSRGAAQAKARLDGLLDRFYDAGTGLCLILSGMEESPCRQELLQFLGQRLCEYRVYQDTLTPLVLILLDDREQSIPALLRGRLRLCRVSLPDQSRRAAYLKKHAASLRNYLSLELFARKTEGASYAQLQDMICVAGCLVDSRDGSALSNEELTAFLAGQMPPPAPEDAMQTLCRSAQQLLEQLPQLLKNAATERVTAQPIQQAAPRVAAAVDGAAFMNDKRQEIEQMPPRDLAVELFGQETVDNMCMSVN